MKRTVKLAILGFATLLCGATTASAQKFGYVNLQEVVALMPEKEEADLKLQHIVEDYSEQLDMIRVEFNNKAQDYQKNQTTLSDAARQMKEKELRDLQARYEEFQQEAQQALQRQQNDLYAPIIEKARNAIQKVGVDNGFTAIFESDALIYMDERNMTNILPLAKAALGIKK